MLLERTFPRSVCFSACRAQDAINKISNEVGPNKMDPAEGMLGRLWADLQYAQPVEVAGDALEPFLDRVQQATLNAAVAVKKSYFLH